MFTAADRDVYLAADLCVLFDLVGQDRFFEPAGCILFQPAGHLNGVWDIPAHPAVQHYVHIRADALAQRLRQAKIAFHSHFAVGGAVAEEPLGRPIAFGHELPGTLLDKLRIDGKAQGAGIGRYFCPGGAAEELADRRVEPVPLQVPQCAVNGAEGHQLSSFAPVHLRAVHAIPQPFRGQWVVAQKKWGQLRLNDKCLVERQGAAAAGNAFVGRDFDKVGGDVVAAFADFKHFVRALGFVFGIDVQWTHQAFFLEVTLRLHLALQSDYGYVCDFHVHLARL